MSAILVCNRLNPGRVKPLWAEADHTSGSLGQLCPDIRRLRTGFGRSWAELGQFWSEFGRNCPPPPPSWLSSAAQVPPDMP